MNKPWQGPLALAACPDNSAALTLPPLPPTGGSAPSCSLLLPLCAYNLHYCKAPLRPMVSLAAAEPCYCCWAALLPVCVSEAHAHKPWHMGWTALCFGQLLMLLPSALTTCTCAPAPAGVPGSFSAPVYNPPPQPTSPACLQCMRGLTVVQLLRPPGP
jgi:hypothetical protein